MNFIDLFDSLTFPEGGNNKTFNTVSIPEYSNFRIGIGIDGSPVLLFSISNKFDILSLKNYRFKYLQLEHGVECKLTDWEQSIIQTFSLILFTGRERVLQEYFLRIAEVLVKVIGNNPTQQQIVESLDRFVEIFRALSETPTNTVHGLWTELFLIEHAADPKVLVQCWHSSPELRYDFNSGDEMIEVKSNSNNQRIHTFSSEQLNPPTGSQVLIASIFIQQCAEGKSIKQLINNIKASLHDEDISIEKINFVVGKTLGNSLEQSIDIKYDYELAKNSLRFYKHQDINKIEPINIPDKVFDVKYRSDLSDILPVVPKEISSGRLFKSI